VVVFRREYCVTFRGKSSKAVQADNWLHALDLIVCAH
jgi:hypothetical protein